MGVVNLAQSYFLIVILRSIFVLAAAVILLVGYLTISWVIESYFNHKKGGLKGD